MSLFNDAGTITSLTRPNQIAQTGDPMALAIAEYSGIVEGTIQRKSALEGFVPMQRVVGTNTVTNYAVGETTLGKVEPGVAPAAGGVDFGRNSVTVDTLVYARNVVPVLDTFLTKIDARREVGMEHGKKIAKFRDQSMFIQAAKAAMATSSAYSGVDGHFGGSREVLAAEADANDPSRLYSAIGRLFIQMEEKDVSPREDDVMLAFRPQQFYTLQEAEQIVNGTYVTADGTRLENVAIFKAWGCPVISSNNIPNTNITGHLLSNAGNGNAYDGDFTKLVGLAFSPRALLGGETIPLTSDVFYDKIYKSWFVDSHLSYAVTRNRSEFAGAILLP